MGLINFIVVVLWHLKAYLGHTSSFSNEKYSWSITGILYEFTEAREKEVFHRVSNTGWESQFPHEYQLLSFVYFGIINDSV